MKIKLQSIDSLNRLGDQIELSYSKATNYLTKIVDYYPSNSKQEWSNQLFYFQKQFDGLTIQQLKEKIYEINLLLLDDFVDNNIKPTIVAICKDRLLFDRLNALKNYSEVELLKV